MSKGHPEDNAQSRFTAFWMIVVSMIVFVIVVSLVLCLSTSGEKVVANEIEDGRAEKRFENLAKVTKEQTDLVNQAVVVDEPKQLVRIPVADGMKLVLSDLRRKKPAASKVVVPGSPTSLKQAQVKPVAVEKKEGAKTEAAKAPEKKPAAKK